MSLRCVLERRLFYQSCCNKCGGILYPNYMVYGEQLRSSERCFIHRAPLFVSSHGGVRLLSISLNKLNIFSRLTSYFVKKKVKDGKPVNDVSTGNICQGESLQDCTHAAEGSSSTLPKENKWMSLVVDKLPFSSPYSIPTPVTPDLRESFSAEFHDVKKHFLKEILQSNESFLQQYDKDLDLILKKATPPSLASKSKQELQTKTKADNKKDRSKNILYPVLKVNKTVAIKTDQFEETRQFLQSMNIPCDELERYPTVQEMSKWTILSCVNMLKERGIHVVFSLFLIDRIWFEMGRPHDKESDSKKKQSETLPLPVTSFRKVRVYLELCQLLETPDLDIRKLLERLADVGLYIDILTLHKKVKKLLAVGATAKDILSNLEILQGYEIFDQKIELYKKSPHVGQVPFPVHLFLAKSLSSFKEQLALSSDADEISKLLGVSVADFQTCWGFKYRSLNKLQYKVNMCLAAGISQKDIFNNLSVLVGLSLDDCHAVTTSFRASGLPASVFVLRDVVNAANLNGNGNNNCGGSNDHKSNDTHCQGAVEGDWMGDAKTLFPKEAPEMLPPNKNQPASTRKNKLSTKKNQPASTRKNELSTKKHRRSIFHLIKHLVNVDGAVLRAMYECHINVGSVDVLDIPKNLDYLISHNFTRQDIAFCPLILANSHSDLVRVVHEAESLILMQLQSAPPSSGLFGPAPGSLSSPSLLMSSSYHTNAKNESACSLLASPQQRLNIYQYFLERENSFSLASTDCERLSGFLNV